MLKRRAYNAAAESALKHSSLGPKRRFNGMEKLLARAGRGLTYQLPATTLATNGTAGESDTGDDDSEEEAEAEERPFEPLMIWQSPHQGAEPKGLPSRVYVLIR